MDLKELRKSRKLTQTDLGLKIGCSQVAISQYENRTRIPNISTIKKMAVVLNISVNEMIEALE